MNRVDKLIECILATDPETWKPIAGGAYALDQISIRPTGDQPAGCNIYVEDLKVDMKHASDMSYRKLAEFARRVVYYNDEQHDKATCEAIDRVLARSHCFGRGPFR